MNFTRAELIIKCKELKISGISKMNKNELVRIIENLTNTTSKIKENKENIKNKFEFVLKQLVIQVPKDKNRKVCKQCYELEHNITSVNCKINIEKREKLRNKIKKYILKQDCLSNETIDDYCNKCSVDLEITLNMCKTLFNDIDPFELLDRPMDIDMYINEIYKIELNCYDCCKKIYNIRVNTNQIWKNNIICDACWMKYIEERDEMWLKIEKYKPSKCEICNSVRKYRGERFHYDHINMFEKHDSICSMVNTGINIEEIYKELDICQIICLCCHHTITDIENKLGFTRLKQNLTRQLNNEEITEMEYIERSKKYQEKYSEKMNIIYKKLKDIKMRENS